MALLIFHSSCIGYVLSLARMGLFHGTFKLRLYSLSQNKMLTIVISSTPIKLLLLNMAVAVVLEYIKD